ncbi:MAG: LamG domain-containing protein, partial [Candidatus Pacearchaeota archaeon]|nr:LamG domain-containing protein [Candidatus Pacearchaeota archaeon]
EGQHNVTVWANDTVGNENKSTVAFWIDTIKPNINFTIPTPDNASSQTATSVYVNVSTNDANEHSAFIDWDRSLVLWMNFDDRNSTDVYDNSSYNNHGKIDGAVYNSSGKRGGGFSFDGKNDQIYMPYNPSLNLTYPISISFWVKLYGYPIDVSSIINTGTGANTANYAVMVASNGQLAIYPMHAAYFTPAYSPPKNEWAYITVMFINSTKTDLYVNGSYYGVAAEGLGERYQTQFCIGANCYFSGSDPNMNMTIDELMIFKLGTAGSCVNITNITWAEGRHNVTVWANDTVGNENKSTITFTIDTIKPDINFTVPTPDNASSQTATSVYVNVSTSDANEHSAFIDWNRSLVRWWSMDSVLTNGTVYDNSSYGRHGVLNNHATNTTISGKRGKAIQFDGINDYIAISSITTTTITISAWINTSSASEQQILHHDGDNNQFRVESDGNIRFLTNSGIDIYIVTTGVDVSDGNWHYVVVTNNGTNASIYVDGIQKIIGSGSPNQQGWNVIGRYNPSEGYFNGSIDEVMIWNRALTPEEINASYNAGTYKLYNNLLGTAGSCVNITNITWAEGRHNVTVWANDTVGNENKSTITFTIDTIKPNINFTIPTPDNASSQTATSIYVNVSTIDANEHSAFIDWNRSLVGWWSMDSYNTSGIYDNSTWNNFGNFSGGELGTGNLVTGKRGEALEFDGYYDYIAVENSPSININGSLTLSSWVYSKEYATAPVVICKGGYGVVNYCLFFSTSGQVCMYDGGDQCSTDIMPTNQWFFLTVAIINSSWSDVYVNGIYNSSISGGGSGTLTNFNLYIGAPQPDYAEEGVNGSLDEVMIFNHVLSPQEIKALYNASANQYYNNFTGLPTGNYNFTAYAIDQAGNVNQTEQRGVTITAETIKPNIAIVTPSNNTYSSNTGLDVNYTVSDNVAIGSCWYSNDTMARNLSLGTAGICENITNITWAEGKHNVTVWANDTVGNENKSTITFGIDIIKPNINFTDPTPDNASSQTATSVYVNVSTSDANEHSAFIDWNRNLVGWWSMDSYNATGVYDNSTWGNHGNFTGGLGTGNLVSGPRGKALEFDGINDYLNIPDPGSNSSLDFDLGDNITISMWIKSDNPTTSGQASLTKGSSSNCNYGTQTNSGTAGAARELVFYYNSGGGWKIFQTSSAVFTSSTWHHTVFTYTFGTSSSAKWYVDGVNVSGSWTSGTGNDAPTISNESLILGRYPGEQFNGSIDEVMIFSRALSPEEINASYNAGTYKLYNNFTGLSAGQYNFTAYAIDAAGNVNQTEQRTVTITAAANQAPNLTFVSVIPATDPTEAGVVNINFNATVYDVNGYSNINNSGINASFTRTGEAIRENSSCSVISEQSAGNESNFTCAIRMWYWDANGTWNITVSAKDNSENSTTNNTVTFEYNFLKAIIINPNLTTWPTLVQGDTNKTSKQNTTLNNTGNVMINSGNIQINAIDLQGMSTTNKYLNVSNITASWNANSDSGMCANISQGNTGTLLVNATYVGIVGANLSRGNVSAANATSLGQETLYFCIPKVPMIYSQTYATNNSEAWTIRILLIALIPKRRKKNKELLKNERLLEALNLITDELKEEYSLNKVELLEIIIEKLKSRYKISRKEILEMIKSEEELKIPITIFSSKLGCLESIAKYMKENLNMNYREIAKEIGRNERTIWTSYKKAKEKKGESFDIKEKGMLMPISIFKDNNLTVLESIILYLKERGMKYSEIARLLNRDQRNIWTTYSRIIKKNHLFNNNNKRE